MQKKMIHIQIEKHTEYFTKLLSFDCRTTLNEPRNTVNSAFLGSCTLLKLLGVEIYLAVSWCIFVCFILHIHPSLKILLRCFVITLLSTSKSCEISHFYSMNTYFPFPLLFTALTTFMSLSFVMTALAVDGEQSRISFISFVPKI